MGTVRVLERYAHELTLALFERFTIEMLRFGTIDRENTVKLIRQRHGPAVRVSKCPYNRSSIEAHSLLFYLSRVTFSLNKHGRSRLESQTYTSSRISCNPAALLSYCFVVSTLLQYSSNMV